jgi:hypothetical protein
MGMLFDMDRLYAPHCKYMVSTGVDQFDGGQVGLEVRADQLDQVTSPEPIVTRDAGFMFRSSCLASASFLCAVIIQDRRDIPSCLADGEMRYVADLTSPILFANLVLGDVGR